MEKILSEHARKRKQLRIETATILVHEFGRFLLLMPQQGFADQNGLGLNLFEKSRIGPANLFEKQGMDQLRTDSLNCGPKFPTTGEIISYRIWRLPYDMVHTKFDRYRYLVRSIFVDPFLVQTFPDQYSGQLFSFLWIF